MRGFNIPDHIYFCETVDQRIFLDLLGDRYFSLSAQADTAFSSLLEAGDQVATSLERDLLVRLGVLVAAPHGKPVAATRHPAPTRSLGESTGPAAASSLAVIVEAWLLVLRARRVVSKKRLPARLKALSSGRAGLGRVSDQRRDRAVEQFQTARRFIPIAPNCLYDSLALCRFLQRRSIAADLVIGAKLHPFGAHCWLQDGTTVLNDSVAGARDFEPVLVA